MPLGSLEGFGLESGFGTKLQQLLDDCRKAGLDFRISQGLRTPQVQAQYYCQWNKRSPADIDKAVKGMIASGAPWLASVLSGYRDIARIPNWQTSALPGAGWHQWGRAADCYCYRNGKMVGSGSDPCYRTYADLATNLGLRPGYYFKKQDSGHVQEPQAAEATDVYTWQYIDQTMQQRFGAKPTLK